MSKRERDLSPPRVSRSPVEQEDDEKGYAPSQGGGSTRNSGIMGSTQETPRVRSPASPPRRTSLPTAWYVPKRMRGTTSSISASPISVPPTQSLQSPQSPQPLQSLQQTSQPITADEMARVYSGAFPRLNFTLDEMKLDASLLPPPTRPIANAPPTPRPRTRGGRLVARVTNLSDALSREPSGTDFYNTVRSFEPSIVPLYMLLSIRNVGVNNRLPRDVEDFILDTIRTRSSFGAYAFAELLNSVSSYIYMRRIPVSPVWPFGGAVDIGYDDYLTDLRERIRTFSDRVQTNGRIDDIDIVAFNVLISRLYRLLDNDMTYLRRI